MTKPLNIVGVQDNFTVGDISGNTKKILSAISTYDTADILVFPELALSGYPPEDLLFKHPFAEQIKQALTQITEASTDCLIVLGYPHFPECNAIQAMDDTPSHHKKPYNALALIQNKAQIATYHKRHLPNYNVFDEPRYFSAGDQPLIHRVKNTIVSFLICEDLWFESNIAESASHGAELIISINASPFAREKISQRLHYVQTQAAAYKVAIFFLNTVGGQDELVFDGSSFYCNESGNIPAISNSFKKDIIKLNHPVTVKEQPNLEQYVTGNDLPLVYQALTVGIKDYVHKNGFSGVILGLSGGIDSALTLALAVDALGKDNVHAVMMPSVYTADTSLNAAQEQANTLNIQYDIIEIKSIYNSFIQSLAPLFFDKPKDTTEENLQARIRGTLLMALSNKHGKMLLSTSNKSEIAVGYSTLYGDMAGGFCALKDVPKTLVYELAHYRNSISAIIPEIVITRPPSAELSHNQTDQDSLPEYDLLDSIIAEHMTPNKTKKTDSKDRVKSEIESQILQKIKRNEYKRRQGPPGTRISTCAFGKDWRHPITSHFNDT